MELYVVEFNSLVFRCSSLSLVVGFVVKAELEIWHARKLTVCLNIANNFRFDDVV